MYFQSKALKLATYICIISSVQSAGEMENDEHTAGIMMEMVRTASRFRLPGTADPAFKRMSGNKMHISGGFRSLPTTLPYTIHSFLSSVILDDFVYVVTISGQKVFVVKRQHNQHEPISV